MHMRSNPDLTRSDLAIHLQIRLSNLSPFPFSPCSSSLRNHHPSPLLTLTTSPSLQHETDLYILSFLLDFASPPAGPNTPTRLSKYQGGTGAAPLLYDPCGTTLPHIEPSAFGHRFYHTTPCSLSRLAIDVCLFLSFLTHFHM